MADMRVLVKRGYVDENGVDMNYYEFSGDHTATKPTAGVIDGSIFLESDTGKVFFFNEEDGDWVEQFSFQS